LHNNRTKIKQPPFMNRVYYQREDEEIIREIHKLSGSTVEHAICVGIQMTWRRASLSLWTSDCRFLRSCWPQNKEETIYKVVGRGEGGGDSRLDKEATEHGNAREKLRDLSTLGRNMVQYAAKYLFLKIKTLIKPSKILHSFLRMSTFS